MKPQNELEQAIINAMDDPQYISVFYEILMKSQIQFVPLDPDDNKHEAHGLVDTSEDLSLQIIQIEIEGVPHTPFFTSVERLAEAITEPVDYYAIEALQFFQMVSKQPTPLIMNPNSDFGKIFLIDEVASLANGEIPDFSEQLEYAEGDSIVVDSPEKIPAELTQRLSQYFVTNSKIKKAYVILMANETLEEDMHYMIVVDCDGDFHSIANTISSVIGQIENIDYPPVDIAPYTESDEDFISEYCRELTPFYAK